MAEARTCSLRVKVLGPLRAWLGERELALGSNRQQTVLAVLAAHPNRLVSQRALITGVWGGEAPASASGNLHTYLSGLRRAFGPARDLLVSGSAGYSLRLDQGALDSALFDQLRLEAEQRYAAGDRRGAVTLLDEGLALWSGEVYAGLRSPFTDRTRRRLEALRLDAVRLRARARLELGEHAELVAELTDLVRQHPLDESAHELLMLALHRGGRRAEALEVFHAARRLLAGEGAKPGRTLTDLHHLVLAGPAERRQSHPLLRVPPPRASPPPTGVPLGRASEVAVLTGALEGVLSGQGRAVWVEGEAGIGKTALLTAALAGAEARSCHLAWAVADEMNGRFPLQVVLDALDVTSTSADRERAALAARLREPAARNEWNRTAPVNRLLAHVAGLCATAPLVLVVDDFQWADDATLLFWDRLIAATDTLPLLLVCATRPPGGRDRLVTPRRGVVDADGLLLPLAPLPAVEVERVVGAVVGASRGPGLRSLASVAAGNPAYAVEIAELMARDGRVRVVNGSADVDDGALADSLGAMRGGVHDVVADLAEDTREVLRSAALLGMRFDVAGLAAVSGRSPVRLLRALDEAAVAQLVVESGDDLAFRHPYVRWVLYGQVPQPMKVALHRQAAEALASANAPVERVVEQLENSALDAWVVRWAAGHHEQLVERVPHQGSVLLRRVLDTGLVEGAERTALVMVLLRTAFRLGLDVEAPAAEALSGGIGPEDAAEARHVLARDRHRRGDVPGAVAVLEDAVRAPGTPDVWRTRHEALIADVRRGALADLDEADVVSERAHARAVAAGEIRAAAYALRNRWFVASVRRDHERALRHVDDALALVGHDRGTAEARCDLLDHRAFTLQNLDRLAEAEGALAEARQVIGRYGLPSGVEVPLAVQRYWTGAWDGALVELGGVNCDAPGLTFYGIREDGPGTVLLHGVSALIALRRDQWANALVHLDAAPAPVGLVGAERESGDFLLFATALAARRRGRLDEAVRLLSSLLRPEEAPMLLRHQWLPHLVRLALEAGRRPVARQAVEACEDEAAREVVPARAVRAAAHCRALVAGDPRALLEVAAQHRSVGRVVELAEALEDAAVAHAVLGDHRAAEEVYAEAAAGYRRLDARWDLARSRQRLDQAIAVDRPTR
ncbi:BTAD domain-containing putative transcriptional regulator [Saccharothrix syringae]|uniref:BTAD domain-containing putative transcriptional regulator n=1 Tax=Saccharothrix syringae TaxID=103733 RepID=UPI00052716AA|nr:BTAD domain-containing putative transcriptional regulator [Saccharothrix syringae]